VELLLLFWSSCYFLELLLGSSIWWRELGETPSVLQVEFNVRCALRSPEHFSWWFRCEQTPRLVYKCGIGKTLGCMVADVNAGVQERLCSATTTA
jgi:hypothetical protein